MTRIKTIISAFIILSLSFSISSCTHHILGYVQSPASVNSANFRIIKSSVASSSKASYFLGILVEGNTDLYYEALRDLNLQSQLKENQYFSNYHVDEKATFFLFPIFYEKSLHLYADVIEYYSSDNPRPELTTISKGIKADLDTVTTYGKIQNLMQCENCYLRPATYSNLNLGEIIAVEGRYGKIYGVIEEFTEKSVSIIVYLSKNSTQIQKHKLQYAFKIISPNK